MPTATMSPTQQAERIAYPVAEVSRLTGLSRQSIYYLISTAVIPSVRLGRRLLIPAEAVARMGGGKVAC